MGIKGFALLLIDVQKGFADSTYWGTRNNPAFEKNIAALLNIGRKLDFSVVHVQHVSKEEKSPLRQGQEGAEFIPGMEPRFGERVFQKNVNSAFIGTQLDEFLKSQNIHSLMVAGLTTDHCVSTSVRMAANFGYRVFIVADCTATFNRRGVHDEYPADVIQDVSLASLKDEFATILQIEEVAALVLGP